MYLQSNTPVVKSIRSQCLAWAALAINSFCLTRSSASISGTALTIDSRRCRVPRSTFSRWDRKCESDGRRNAGCVEGSEGSGLIPSREGASSPWLGETPQVLPVPALTPDRISATGSSAGGGTHVASKKADVE